MNRRCPHPLISICQRENCPYPKVCSDRLRCVLPNKLAWRRSGCGRGGGGRPGGGRGGCDAHSVCMGQNCHYPKVCSDRHRCVLPNKAAWFRSGCHRWGGAGAAGPPPAIVRDDFGQNLEEDKEDKEDKEVENPCTGPFLPDPNSVYRCPKCDGLNDSITLAPIPMGEGVCIDRQCYGSGRRRFNLDTWLKKNPSVPHSRNPLTQANFRKYLRGRRIPHNCLRGG